jgi:hypothetical protein
MTAVAGLKGVTSGTKAITAIIRKNTFQEWKNWIRRF